MITLVSSFTEAKASFISNKFIQNVCEKNILFMEFVNLLILENLFLNNIMKQDLIYTFYSMITPRGSNFIYNTPNLLLENKQTALISILGTTITIEGGIFTPFSSVSCLVCSNSNIDISRSIFKKCSGPGAGAIKIEELSMILIDNSDFEENYSESEGAAISTSISLLIAYNSRFKANFATAFQDQT